jgi:glycosyltransferase involved in cell wall biosynthesis
MREAGWRQACAVLLACVGQSPARCVAAGHRAEGRPWLIVRSTSPSMAANSLASPRVSGRYLLGMMAEWARTPRIAITVVLHAEPSADIRAAHERFSWHVEPAEIGGTWWEQRALPRALAAIKPDVLLAPGYTAPLRSIPAVRAVRPRSCRSSRIPSGSVGAKACDAIRHAARRASRTRRSSRSLSSLGSEIARYLGVPAGQIELAPPGAPAVRTRRAGRKASPWCCMSGSLFNRRHLADMIQAFAQVSRQVPAARLVLVGDNRTTPRQDPRALAASCGIADRVDWREYVKDEELRSLYQSRRVFLFLSDYEGFGIPPMEAFAHGVPAVVLDTPVSREVYGDGAVRVASDPGAIAAATCRDCSPTMPHMRPLSLPAGRACRSTRGRTQPALLTRALEEAAR